MISRRRFILSSTIIAVSTDCLANEAAKEAQIQLIIDTVVPRTDSIGAIDLNLHLQLWHKIHQEPSTRAWVERLIGHIEQKSKSLFKRPFKQLNLGHREAVLQALLTDNRPQIRFDTKQLREMILTWFYQHPKAQSALNFVLPSQYVNYQAAP